MTRPSIVDRITVAAISIKKFQPIKPTNMKPIIAPNDSLPAPPTSMGRKNTSVKTQKINVFMTGTITPARMIPSSWFLSLKSLNRKPATKPAIVHLHKQAITVPAGLTGMNIASVEGENKAMMPLKKPTIAPDNGPYNTAAKTIATSEILILTGPNWR